MFAPYKIRVGARAVALALALATSSFSAHAVLERVGPVDTSPAGGSYPAWYQDTTGITLEFCSPSVAELNGGWCLLLPPAPAPEVFPNQFFDEHFYFASTAQMSTQQAGKALLVMAEEGAFATGPVIPGDQITFSRIRVVLNPVPVTGTYRFIHPYGEEIIDGVAGGKIFFTDDVGISCAQGQFDCSLASRMGPFLLPSATPGGPEMPALTAANPTPDTDPAHFGGLFAPTPYPGTGKAYIADPSRIGPVTGSSLPDFVDSTGALRNHNIFRVEGPAGAGLGINPATGAVVDWIETTDFTLMGRLFDGAMPTRATVERASYTRNANGLKLDVLAVGEPATNSRLPTQPPAAKEASTLTFFDAPCAGVVDAAGNIRPPYSAPVGAVETQMFSTGSHFWGQTNPAALPAEVCVKHGNARDLAGQIVPLYVPDEVTITSALYDQTAKTLTVAATSSDELAPPVLTLAYANFTGDLVGGQVVVPNVNVPPANVSVFSSAKGENDLLVTTNQAAPPAPLAPVGVADSFTVVEDSGPNVLNILANDTFPAVGTLTLGLTSSPVKGTATLNPDNTVTYRPALNANGADSFTYVLTWTDGVSILASLPTTASINITPVNDPPVAVNDNVTVTIGVASTVNLIANDTDPDGNADVVAIGSFTQPAGGAVTVTAGATPGTVTILATATGTFTFSYTAQDVAGAQSTVGTGNNQGLVTLTVNPAETVAINKNQYDVRNAVLSLEGTTTPPSNTTVTIALTDNAGTVLSTVGSTTVSAGRFKFSAATPLPLGATRVQATTASGAVTSGALILK